jgi:signal transduction histidine kinase
LYGNRGVPEVANGVCGMNELDQPITNLRKILNELEQTITNLTEFGEGWREAQTPEGFDATRDGSNSNHSAHVGDIYKAAVDNDTRVWRGSDLPAHRNEIAETAGQIACGIAPELNGLLHEINKNSEFLLNGPELPPEAGERTDQIRRAGEQAATLAGWLLAFNRRQTQQFRVIDLNGLIRGLRCHLRAILPQNVELDVALEPALPDLMADENSLQEALIHLVVNARDAMPNGGRLTVETTTVRQRSQGEPEGSTRTYALLRVTDTGVGMDASTQSRIFEPFFTCKLHAPAAGLGLSAVYGIVRQAGGWISVYTEKGAGSSVEIFLPCANG